MSTKILTLALLIVLPLNNSYSQHSDTSNHASNLDTEIKLNPYYSNMLKLNPHDNTNLGGFGGEVRLDLSGNTNNSLSGAIRLFGENLGPNLNSLFQETGPRKQLVNRQPNWDITSGDCTLCRWQDQFNDNATKGLEDLSQIESKLPRFYCEFPDTYSLSSFRTEEVKTFGYKTEGGDVDFCSCVAGVKEQFMSFYGDVNPSSAQNLCKQAGQDSTIEKYNKHFDSINSYGMLQKVAQSVLGITETPVTCDSDTAERMFKTTFGSDIEGGRLCSAQSVAYIVKSLEGESTNRARTSQYNETMALAERIASGQAGGPMTAAQKDAQGKFDAFTKSSPIFEQKKRQFDEIYLSSVKGLFPDAEGSKFDSKTLAELTKNSGFTKVQIVTKLLKVIQNNMGLRRAFSRDYGELIKVDGDEEQSKAIVAMTMSPETMTEEAATKLLEHFASFSAKKCEQAQKNLLTQCKIVSSGISFQPNKLASHRCDLEKKPEFNDLIDEPLRAFQNVINNHDGDRHMASQIMCFQVLRHGSLMHEYTAGHERSCEEGTNSISKFRGLTPELAVTGGVESTFLGSRYAEVVTALSNCTPFKVGALGDEVAPFTDAGGFAEYLDSIESQRDTSGVADAQISIMNAQARGEDPADALRKSLGPGGTRLASSRVGGTTIGDLNDARYPGGSRDAFSEISANAARSVASTESEYSSASDSFYNKMGETQQVFNTAPDFSSFVPSDTGSSSDDSRVSAASNASSSELEEERDRIDAYLQELERLRAENQELLAELNRKGVKEVVNEDGEAVSVEDAFAETNRRIEEQRKRALQEREEIEQRFANMDRVQPNSQANSAVSNSSRGLNESRPNASSTPNSNSISSNSSASRSIASTAGGDFGGGAASAGSTSASSGGSGSDQYGPAPVRGLVLTSEELSIAKPNLNLAGRSLNESVDVVKAAIAAVKGEVVLPVQFVNGKSVSEYILQEQDGRTVMVYLDGEQVVVADVDLAVDSVQDKVVVEDTPEQEPTRAPAQSGRKAASWDDVVQILNDAQQ